MGYNDTINDSSYAECDLAGFDVHSSIEEAEPWSEGQTGQGIPSPESSFDAGK